VRSILNFRKYWNREIALGTAAGSVLSLVCDEKEKKERGAKAFLDSTAGESVTGLAQLLLPSGGLLLLLATPTCLYAFRSPDNTLEALGAAYQGTLNGEPKPTPPPFPPSISTSCITATVVCSCFD